MAHQFLTTRNILTKAELRTRKEIAEKHGIAYVNNSGAVGGTAKGWFESDEPYNVNLERAVEADLEEALKKGQ